MEQQVVIEFLGMLGQQSLDFTDNPIKVKTSPHSLPTVVSTLILDNREVEAEINGEIKSYTELTLPVKQSIGQRIRLITHKSNKFS